MNKLLVFSLLTLFFACNGSQNQKEEYFTNPIIHGDMADPSVIRIDDTYYLTATSSEWAPFYPVFSSTDLVNWKQTGHIFDKQPEWTSSSFWAPELFYHNNKVYCYYTARRKTDNVSYIGVAIADNMDSPFIDHGLLVEYGSEAIDAFVYDDEGQLYISWKAYGLDERPIEIIGSKLSADGLKLEGEPFTLLKDDEGIGMEGQYHFKKGDYYYIIYSPNDCCGPKSNYDVYVARSKTFKGPYEKYEGNPILRGDGIEFISCGHGTAVLTPDNRMYYICHAYLAGEGVYNGRQHILQEMVMTEDNWVGFTSGNIATVKQEMPFPNTVQKSVEDIHGKYDFWTWNYVYANPVIDINEEKIILSGNNKEGYSNGTVLCIRPLSPNYEYEVKVENKNESLKGLTMYGDDQNLVSWGIKDDQLHLQMIVDGNIQLNKELSYAYTPIYLKIKVTQGCNCAFFYSHDGKEWIPENPSPTDCSKLVRWDRVARPGLVHQGEILKPAEFSSFVLKNI